MKTITRKFKATVKELFTHHGFHTNLLYGLAGIAIMLPIALLASSDELSGAAAKIEVLRWLIACYVVLIIASWIGRD